MRALHPWLTGTLLIVAGLLVPFVGSASAALPLEASGPAPDGSAVNMLPVRARLPALGSGGALPAASQISTAQPPPPPEQVSSGPEVEAELRMQFEAHATAGYLIYFRAQPDLSPAFTMSWHKRGRFVVNVLQQTALRSQAKVRAYLDAQGADYQAFWIDSVIVVKSSGRETFNGLMSFPEIAALRARRTMRLIEPVNSAGSGRFAPMAIESNIAHVGADQVWGMGFTGEQIVVANIDTGVRYTHEALVGQYRGNLGGGSFDHDYNWLGAAGGSSTPVDDHNHGSHTMGIMLGDDGGTNQIGMAPGAQWIACDGCEFVGCPDTALLTCAEWVVAPYPTGSPGSADPDKRPHVVNNSWGDCGQAYDDWYQGSVDSWHAAGIYPIFSNGNASNCGYPEPPGCNTAGNPARYGNVTGVGSTGKSDGQYASHSNWGPTDNPDTVNPRGYPDLKPQVLAPGVNIRSSVAADDSAYGSMGGTSMSAPHVAGLIALMWDAAPCLMGDYAATETIIEQTATPIPYASGCGGEGPGNVPNHATGWGEIDAPAAVQAAMNACGDSVLDGIAYESGGTPATDPVAGASVQAAGLVPTHTASTTSGADGYYRMGLFSDTYTVTVTAYGYEMAEIGGVSVVSGTTTTLNIPLSPAPMHVVSGTVTDATTGWPLYAGIDIPGYPAGTVWTDPATGFYSVTLPGGSIYAFDVNAWVDGYDAASRDVGPLTADVTESFALMADLNACAAPGYRLVGLSEDFETWPPAGWTIVDNEGTGVVWDSCTNWGDGNYTDGAGDCADVNSDIAGMVDYDTELWSPVLDVATLSTTTLRYLANYQDIGGGDLLELDVSTNGGSSWTNVLSWDESHGGFYSTPGEQVVMDLSPYLSGSNNVIRWHYHNSDPGDWDWYAQVDEVRMGTAACVPMAGGLVIGNVYDANTNDPLTGAIVGNEDGYVATAEATPDDANVDDGFYTAFSPQGTKTFTATMTGGYGPDTATVTVVQSDTVRQDFHLPAASLSVDPQTLEATLLLGTSLTTPLTLTNSGGLSATFELREVDRGFEVAALSGVQVPGYQVPELKNEESYAGQRLSSRESWVYQPATDAFLSGIPADVLLVAAADVTQIRAMLQAYPDIDVVDYFDARIGTPTLGQLLAYDTAIVIASSAFTDPAALGDVLADYVDAGGTVIQTVPTFYGSGWGLQGRFVDEGYSPFIGTGDWFSWADLGGFDPTHPIMQGVTAAGDDLRQVVDLATGADWVADWTDDEFVATKGSVVALNTFLADGYHWTGDVDVIVHNSVIWLQTGGDVEWLSEDPITGTVAADGGLALIDVTLDAAKVTQPGEYRATLNVNSNDPLNNRIGIPVTMTVNAPASWGRLEGTVTSLGHCDANVSELEGAEVLIENGSTVTVTTDVSGAYAHWLEQGTYTVTVSAAEHLTDAAVVGITAQMTTTKDFGLRWLRPCVSVEPIELSATVDLGLSTTLPMTITNSGGLSATFELREVDRGFRPAALGVLGGHGEWLHRAKEGSSPQGNSDSNALAYPAAYRWEPAAPSQVAVLIYADDWIHPAPSTYPDQALQTLGYAYTAHYNGDFAGFETDLAGGGPWDLVLFANDNNTPPASTLTALDNYVTGGGKLLLHTWRVSGYPGDALWTSLGFAWVSDVTAGDDIYWWDPGHLIFDGVPDFVGLTATGMIQGQRVEPLAGFEPLAGYTTPGPDPNEAALILGNDGRTVFKGFIDAGNDLNNDGDGTLDGVELWMNLIEGIQVDFGGDVEWLSEDPITGTVGADSAIEVDVTFTTFSTMTSGTYSATLIVRTDDPVNPRIDVAITLIVQEPQPSPPAGVCLPLVLRHYPGMSNPPPPPDLPTGKPDAIRASGLDTLSKRGR